MPCKIAVRGVWGPESAFVVEEAAFGVEASGGAFAPGSGTRLARRRAAPCGSVALPGTKVNHQVDDPAEIVRAWDHPMPVEHGLAEVNRLSDQVPAAEPIVPTGFQSSVRTLSPHVEPGCPFTE